jgi:hypothetical protein
VTAKTSRWRGRVGLRFAVLAGGLWLIAGAGSWPWGSLPAGRRDAGVFVDVGAGRVVVGLVDQVGLAGSLVAEPGEHPGQALADVGEVGRRVAGLVELVLQRGGGVAQLAVVDAQPADPVAQPRLGAGDVGQQAVWPGRIVGLFGCCFAQDGERPADLVAPPRRGG